MGVGVVILIVAAIWAVVLATKTTDLLGQKVLVLGDNILEPNAYGLSTTQYILFWAIAIGGMLVGILIIANSNSDKSEPTSKEELLQNKKCPQCAEYVKWEARICRHCQYRFSEDEIKIVTEKVAKARYCPRCNNDYPLDEEYCPICTCDLLLK